VKNPKIKNGNMDKKAMIAIYLILGGMEAVLISLKF
jgi:hypothetical protein